MQFALLDQLLARQIQRRLKQARYGETLQRASSAMSFTLLTHQRQLRESASCGLDGDATMKDISNDLSHYITSQQNQKREFVKLMTLKSANRIAQH